MSIDELWLMCAAHARHAADDIIIPWQGPDILLDTLYIFASSQKYIFFTRAHWSFVTKSRDKTNIHQLMIFFIFVIEYSSCYYFMLTLACILYDIVITLFSLFAIMPHFMNKVCHEWVMFDSQMPPSLHPARTSSLAHRHIMRSATSPCASRFVYYSLVTITCRAYNTS